MRFNSKELMAVAIQPSYKFDKEGALYIKEKQEGLFRRSDVFTQRWCRLRGNLLFYYKSKDQYSEPAGVFVLEQCSVKLESNAEMPHTFSLVFQGDGYGQQLAAGSEGERDSWIQALHMASYEYMRTQLSSLKEKLKSKKADEDWSISQTSVSKRHRSFTTGSSCDPQLYEPFMELSICCDNLKCDGDGQPPSPLVCVSINTPPLLNWVKFAQTEVIEKSSNPCFLTTVTFVKGEVSELTRVKLSVYDVRERVTCTSTLLGGSAFTLYNLIQSQHRSLRLTLISPSCASVGFITVSARELNSAQQRNAWLQLEEEGSLWSKVERPRSYSLPTKLTSQVATPVLGQLKTLSSNFTTQTYRFHTGLGAELHVHEIMAESKLTFYVPQMLLNLWINEEKRLMDNILLLGELSDEWQQKQLAATESHLHLINHYTETVNFLSTQKNSSFKPSAKKKDISFEFIPVNLHLQRMWVQNVTTRKTGVYDIVTVGAFSAFSQRFRHGGLLRLLNQLKAYSPLISRDNGSAILGPDPISRSAEAIKRIEQIKEEIEKDLQNILVYSQQKAGSALQTVLNSLSSKGNQLTHVCLPQLVDDASSLWETIRPNSADGKVCLYPEMSSITISDKLESVKGSDSVKPDVVPSKEHDNPVELKDTKAAKKNDATHGDDVNNTTHNLKKDEECNGHISPEHEKNDESFPCKSNDKSNSSSSKSSPDEMEPLDLTHLNIKASIMCMASKVQYFVNESKTASSGGQQAASDGQETNWTAELMPSIKKLRQAIRCLYKTANSTYGLISLKESATSSSLSQIVRYRRDIVFSQGLTSLITGLMTRIWCQDPDAMFVHMLRTVGVLAHFEGLLSCYGDEMGALEDMVVGVDDLRRVLFWLEPCDSCINPLPRIDGSRLYLSVVIPAPQSVISLLPKECSTGCHFTVSSVFFNIGINEQAMLAEKFGDTSLQEKINLDSLNLLKDHYSRFQRAAKNLKNHGFRYSESHITELMQQLESQVLSKKSKNVEILHLAAEICRHLGGIRFTSCKSAKDRTSMSVTLEQTMVLLKDFNLDEKEMQRVLECMRSVGTRRENTLKNVGVRKYAFTSLQLMTVPKLYRPPAGTYGSVAS